MNKITNINRKALTDLRPAINAALKAVAEEYGVSLHAGNGSYDDGNTGHFKLEITALDASGEVVDLSAEAFKEYAPLYHQIPADALGKTFGNYTFVGYKPKARKNCFVVEVKGRNGQYVIPSQTAIAAYRASETSV